MSNTDLLLFILIMLIGLYIPILRYSETQLDKLINYLEKQFKKNKIMKKYKLIKEYPGSWEKNTIVNIASDNIHVLINGVCSPLNPQEIMDYPEYWEEVIEKDYEILSYKHLGTISKVKRLSDGEIFTIGDKTEFGDIIKYFKIDNKSNLLIIGYKDCEDILEFVKHSKQKLFTTEDDLDIFEGDLFYYVKFVQYNNTLGKPFEIVRGDYPSFEYEPQYEKYFSTKEKAEEYILYNKPCLSLKDVASIYPGIRKDHSTASHQAERLKELVKSKL